MNHDRIIKGTNTVALYATVALFYWVFVFLVITAFDLRIFREHMTEIFYLSLLGIFAILGGAIVLNVMSNLSKISSALSEERDAGSTPKPLSRAAVGWAALSFPLICVLLFGGNHLSAEKKKAFLISSARKLMAENRAELEALADYRFSRAYVKKAVKILGIIGSTDRNFPEVVLIRRDRIDAKNVFLRFGGRHVYWNEGKPIDRAQFIYSASSEERAYLDAVFSGAEEQYRFSSHKGHYELYFPAEVNGGRMVFYFSDYQRYGKIGS